MEKSIKISENNDKVNLIEIKPFEHYELSYGNVSRNTKEVEKVVLSFNNIFYLSSQPSCQCINPEIIPTQDGFTANIIYDTSLAGIIRKYITFQTSIGQIKLDLRGNII